MAWACAHDPLALGEAQVFGAQQPKPMGVFVSWPKPTVVSSSGPKPTQVFGRWPYVEAGGMHGGACGVHISECDYCLELWRPLARLSFRGAACT